MTHNHTSELTGACETCKVEGLAQWDAQRARAVELSGADIDEIVKGYLDAQLWVTTDDLWQLDDDNTRYLELQNARKDRESLPYHSGPGELLPYQVDTMARWVDTFGLGSDDPNARVPASELSEHGENLDEFYSLDDISSDYVEAITEEITDFVAAHPLAVRMYGASRAFDPSQGSVWSCFGHDLLLTRDGHCAGFWDRGPGELGEYLTKHASELSSSAYLFDGRLAVDPTSEPVLLADN